MRILWFNYFIDTPAISLWFPLRANLVVLGNSWPNVPLYSHDLTYPTIRVYTNFLFRPFFPRKISGPSPSLSRTPCRKGSMRTSASAISFFASCTPSRILRFTAIDRFPRANRSGWVAWSSLSIRVTDAPQSARNSPVSKRVSWADIRSNDSVICTTKWTGSETGKLNNAIFLREYEMLRTHCSIPRQPWCWRAVLTIKAFELTYLWAKELLFPTHSMQYLVYSVTIGFPRSIRFSWPLTVRNSVNN